MKKDMILEGNKATGGGGGGNGRIGIVHEDEMGDRTQCTYHPFRNNQGGICAFCLQDKLGKLVSSSFPLPPNRSFSSSSSSPYFRSDHYINAGSSTIAPPASSSSSLSLAIRRPASIMIDRSNGSSDFHHHNQYFFTGRVRVPFLLSKKKKKYRSSADNIVFKRSKSTASTNPRRSQFSESDDNDEFSPRKKGGFWSFFYLSSKKMDKNLRDSSSKMSPNTTTSTVSGISMAMKQKDKCLGSSFGLKNPSFIVEDNEEISPNRHPTVSASASVSSSDRKVSRSRSVGCGSRSFSGDFFERISTGFGDCTLRRVESQREGKPKGPTSAAMHHRNDMKERVKCGGIFSGFMITSSSSSSSSSSYLVSSSSTGPDHKIHNHHHHQEDHVNGKLPSTEAVKGWGSWAFASPMRAFGKQSSSSSSSKEGKRVIIRDSAEKNTKPDLNAIPSLLTVSTG